MAAPVPGSPGDVNGNFVNQYGPWPTAGLVTGAAVAVANTLLLTNYYVVGVGGPKANSNTNYLAQVLTTTP